jgi:hypothetical protein
VNARVGFAGYALLKLLQHWTLFYSCVTAEYETGT